MFLVIPILLFLIFGHNLFGDYDEMWYYSWLFKDASIALLCSCLYHILPATRPKLRSAFLLIAIMLIVMGILSVAGYTIEHDKVIEASLAIGLFLWCSKQLLLYRFKTENLGNDTYYYGLAKAKGALGILNILNPFTLAEYGGRIVIANDDVYMVHKGIFRKIKRQALDKTKLSEFVFVDTGVRINSEDTARLDNFIGDKMIPFIHDCSAMQVKVSITALIFKRIFR